MSKRNIKSSGSVARVRKNHGPKRHLFADYGSLTYEFGRLGLLTKYSNFESFKLSCMARGCKNPTKTMWNMFSVLKTNAEKDEWLKNIKANVKICRDEDEKKAPKKPIDAIPSVKVATAV